MAWREDIEYLKRAIEISRDAFEAGNEPFGALLAGPDGEILFEQKNEVGELHDHTAHDAFLVASNGSRKYDPDFLWGCTLYATIEPCLMCLGGVFWANIGNVKFAMKESELNAMFGGDPLVTIHSDLINEHLAKEIKISGPYDAIVPDVKEVILKWMDTLK